MPHCMAPFRGSEPLLLKTWSQRGLVPVDVVGLRIAPSIDPALSTRVFLPSLVQDLILYQVPAPSSGGLGLRCIRSSLGIAVSDVVPL